MTTLYEDEREWFPPEDDELIRRLRNLKWPEVQPEVRERCWREFQKRIAKMRESGEHLAPGEIGPTLPEEPGETGPSEPDAREERGTTLPDRYECTRRQLTQASQPVASRRIDTAGAVSRSWARRESLKPSIAVA